MMRQMPALQSAGIAMVGSAAQMAESELARRALVAAARSPEPGRPGAPTRRQPIMQVNLSGLGRSECVVSIGPGHHVHRRRTGYRAIFERV
jgi:hypothetical protein